MSAIQSAIQMRSITASYTTRNRLGIYIFQYRIPARFRHNYSSRKILFRKSLKTRNKRIAVKRARQWIELMDKIAKKYFDNPEDYETALKLLAKHKIAEKESKDHSDYETALLSALDDIEFKFLKDGLVLKTEISEGDLLDTENTKILREIKALKSLIESQRDSNEAIQLQAIAYSTEDNPYLTELFERWEAAHKTSMKPSSFVEFSRMIEFFIRVVNEMNTKEITIAELDVKAIRHYKEILQKIPKGVRTNNKSIVELTEISGSPKSRSTVKNILVNVGQFILWAKQEGYKVADNIHEVLTSFPRTKSGQTKKRYPFDDNDLVKLFNSEQYLKGLFKNESDYWAPLIALFTGALESEILQLHCSDIYKDADTGINVIDINSNSDDKSLKVDGGNDDGRPRLVPVHPILDKLGFIEFISDQKEKGFTHLFPSEKRNERGQFRAYSGRFGRYRDKVGAGPRNKNEFRDFHSFRHLVKTKLSNIEHHDGLIDDILGHTSSSRSNVGRGYSHANRLELKYRALKRVKYDCINFSSIRNWRYLSRDK